MIRNFCFHRLLKALESLANNVPVQKNETIVIEKKNIAMGVKIVDPEETAGLLIKASPTDQPNVNRLSLANTTDSSTTEETVATIFLSQMLFNKTSKILNDTQRITTFIFDNEKLFMTRLKINDAEINRSIVLNSKILSAAIKGIKLYNLTKNEKIHSTFSELKTGGGRSDCVFWDFDGEGKFVTLI